MLIGKTIARNQRGRGVGLSGRRMMILLATIPTVAFYLLWVGIPMLYSFIMSFHDWNPLATSQPFLGLGNYHEAVSKDFIFWLSLRNTLYYTLITVPVGAVLALFVALLVNSQKRLVGFFRTTYFIPVVTSVVATSIMWRWLYQPRFGLINQLIKLILVDTLGISMNPSIQWLTSTSLAMPSVMAMSIWKGLGFTMVLFLAGLTSIPSVYYEAAKIDGAGRWHLFRHVTLPLLQPTLVFVLVTGVIGGLQVFTPMYIMTQGGPVNSTKTIVYLLYEKAFTVYRFGYASSLAFILFVIILVLTVIQLRVMTVRWEY
ncbi:MAG: sugar ABC transporter permease [Anaerolineae bacterium]|nr:sugar ABC transporter permease [Anaerolineae bacterium]